MLMHLKCSFVSTSLAIIGCFFLVDASRAASLALSDSPLFVSQTVPPLTMLVMARDHRLFYEAYNDASDINGDGTIDVGYIYDPSFKYYGYFDSDKCYVYDGTDKRFEPSSVATNKKCTGEWSGDFLNYLTTARMDAIRKVLYGGYRSTDNTSITVLERTHVPQDAHSWGKMYQGVTTDGYDISDYTPYALPTAGKTHLFANTTLLKSGSGEPRLRVLTNTDYKIWQWLSKERPVAHTTVVREDESNDTVTPTDFFVRVVVCDDTSGLPVESNCTPYPNGKYKPTGLLHNYGENNSMYFGLITGSYAKNHSGGVLRKNIESFTDEVDTNTGVYTAAVGIVRTIDRIKVHNFGGSYTHDCGFIFKHPVNEGECAEWGNPTAEMMYEAVRYFQGKGAPTAAYDYTAGDDVALGLPKVAWVDPYDSNEKCAKPNILLISDLFPSFDSDQLPGSYFGTFIGDVSPALDVSALGDTIWNNEIGGSGSYFIGQSQSDYDGAPTPKTVNSFSNIRGLAPEAPTKQGSYYSASVAYYAHNNDMSDVDGDQKVATFVVALSSPLPTFNFDVSGNTVTMVPFAKTVDDCGGVNPTEGDFQPTNTIVDFYIQDLGANSGTFRINFEDAEQGADHDMDFIVLYNYEISAGKLKLGLAKEYQAGGCVQNAGYVISGTATDGLFLDITDEYDENVSYFLNTHNTSDPSAKGSRLAHRTTGVVDPNDKDKDGNVIPVQTPREFTPSGSPAATLLNSPLWYTAKWGYFNDSNGNNVPDLDNEWDADGDGVPDNYFLVTNPANIASQLATVFTSILARSTSASAAALNSGSLSTDTRLYQAIFNTETWHGQLLSFSLNTTNGEILTTGPGPGGSNWDASILLDSVSASSRKIITYNPSSEKGVAFRWPSNPSSPTTSELSSAQIASLKLDPDDLATPFSDSEAENILNYLRGDQTNEMSNGGTLRNRTTILGDIVNSNPPFIGAPSFRYPEIWPGSGSSETSYLTFKTDNASRKKMVAVGANDGMLHLFDAETGESLLGYVPAAVFNSLTQLPNVNYDHKYYVDGTPNYADAFFDGSWHTVLVGGLNNGGQGVFALDITDPNSFSESNANDIVLWEFTDADDSDLGQTYSMPAIVRLASGDWVAIFGNGYNNTAPDGTPSTTGNAVLYIVDLETGALLKKIDTGVGMAEDPLSAGRPNGLSTPAIVDLNGDAVADYAYAGDLFGNLWKFDLTSTNKSGWKIAIKHGATYKPLFVAEDSSGNRQAITSRPNVGTLFNEVGKVQVYFGTGRYIEDTDKTDTSTQTFYGIEDHMDNNTVERSELLEQTILDEVTASGYEYRVTSDSIKTSSNLGWYLDFDHNADGERMVSNSILRNNRIIFSTLIPSSDPCDFGGTGWLMDLDAQTGARLTYSPFDVDKDGTFTTGDNVSYSGSGSKATVSGRKSTVGIIPAAGIIATMTKEYKYTPGTSGAIEKIDENIGPDQEGRQSWRQLK